MGILKNKGIKIITIANIIIVIITFVYLKFKKSPSINLIMINYFITFYTINQ